MLRRELMLGIRELVNEELLFANQKFPLFASPHEGYAVLKEEIEETLDESKRLDRNIELLWCGIKKNENVMPYVGYIEDYALQCAAEAIQVVAMCRKYKQSLGK